MSATCETQKSACIETALKIQGWMTPEELSWLYDQASEMESVIEIGAWKGRSSFVLGSACPGPTLCVDHWLGSDGERHLAHKEAVSGDIYSEWKKNTENLYNIAAVKGNSADVAILLPNAEMIFVDGGHKHEEVLSDLYAYAPKATKLFCGHDYNFAAVYSAVDTWASLYGKVPRKGPGSLWFLVKDEFGSWI
jgi:hypothetical protein